MSDENNEPYDYYEEKAAEASIDSKAREEYEKYANADNQSKLKEKHRAAYSDAYQATVKFMEDQNIPLHGGELSEEQTKLVAVEFLTNVLDKVNKKHKIREAVDDKEKLDEKLQYLTGKASELMGIKDQYIRALIARIQSGEEIGGSFNEVIGKHVNDGKAVEYLKQVKYEDIYNKIEYNHPEVFAKHLKEHPNFKKFEKIDGGKKLKHLDASNAQDLIDALMDNSPMHAKILEKRYGLKEKHYEA